MLWYYRDEPFIDVNWNNIDIPDDPETTPFNYKQKITGQTGNNRRRDVQIIAPLKYLSNFWRTFEIINCEINFFFKLGWKMYYSNWRLGQ